MVEVVIRPTSGPALGREQIEGIARTANASGADATADGGARFSFDASRYDAATARGNVEMAARMTLGAHWQVRYEVA
jgi:hypothetical protein